MVRKTCSGMQGANRIPVDRLEALIGGGANEAQRQATERARQERRALHEEDRARRAATLDAARQRAQALDYEAQMNIRDTE